MKFLIGKSNLVNIKNIFFILSLSACSFSSQYKKQINSNKLYLNTEPLIKFYEPLDVILPTQDDYYNIKIINENGAIGSNLDIRPPTQPLNIIVGSQIYSVGDTITLLFNNNYKTNLWFQILNILKCKNYAIKECDDSNQILITDWITWNRFDEDKKYQGIYQISLKPVQHQKLLILKLLSLKCSEKLVTDIFHIKKYNTEMFNFISNEIENLN